MLLFEFEIQFTYLEVAPSDLTEVTRGFTQLFQANTRVVS
jgi:hypothetical protein